MSVTAVSTEANALEVQGVGRRFGGFWAVKDMSLTVKQGERRAVLGPNGAGKTTLFNVLAGDLAASTGNVKSFGVDVTGFSVEKRVKNGMRRTYQHALLFEGLTVRETLFLAVAGLVGGWGQLRPVKDSDPRMAKADSLAQIAGLDAVLHREVGELSHGQRRQLEIGIALAESPKLLLLDEPAAGLSPSERPKLTELLLSLPADVSVVLIEHDLDIALQVCDQVTVMHNGELLAEGSPQEIMSDSRVHDVYVGGTHDS